MPAIEQPLHAYAPPTSVAANPGPPARGSYAGQRSTGAYQPTPPPKAPPDIFAGYVGPAIDASKQMVQQFLTLLGYQSGLDANTLTLQLLQNNLLGEPLAAAQFLFNSGVGMTDDLRKAHPNAAFGLDSLTFQTRKDALDATFGGLIAQDPAQLQSGGDALHALYYQAFRENWGQGQILQRLQTDPAFAQLRSDQPWILAGQGEQQASQQFASLFGMAPVDVPTLASWFRFNTGTQSLNRAGREAIESAAPMPSASTSR